MSEISFADLRCRFQTGRSFIISGEGRNRVYGYRNGVQCALGDLEQSQWCELTRALIDRKGEQELHTQLLQYLKDHNYIKGLPIAIYGHHAVRCSDRSELSSGAERFHYASHW